MVQCKVGKVIKRLISVDNLTGRRYRFSRRPDDRIIGEKLKKSAKLIFGKEEEEHRAPRQERME